MFTDSHAHLASSQFAADLPAVIERAREAHVTRIICLGTTLEDSKRVLELADEYSEVDACVGIHPCDADTVPRDDADVRSSAPRGWLEELQKLARHPKVVAIGEIGLDYFHPPPKGFSMDEWKAHQGRVLDAQLDLAAELGLNVVLHNRDSFADLCMRVLPWSDRLHGVFHCFTGSWEDAKPLIERGHLVSFTGIVTFKNAKDLQTTARAVPERLFMLETDCPYLAPMPYRGKRNEPAYVAQTAEFVAKLRDEDVQLLAEHTNHTATEFFRHASW